MCCRATASRIAFVRGTKDILFCFPSASAQEFRLQKDKMLLRGENVESKEREYIVVSMTPRFDSDTADATPFRVNHLQ